MMTTPLFHGVIPPVATLFDDNGRFSPEEQGRLIERLVEAMSTACFSLAAPANSRICLTRCVRK